MAAARSPRSRPSGHGGLGQADVDARILLAPDGAPTARNFHAPAGVAFGPDFLATMDSDAMRVLIFRDAP